MCLSFVLYNLKEITDSHFKPVFQTDNDTTSRAPSDRWFPCISSLAALAPMNEEVTAAAHFIRLLWIQIEGAGFGKRGIMHSILAES